MAPRFPRRRGNADQPDDDEDTVDLDDADHAWWAQRDVGDVWRPRPEGASPQEEPERDVLAEHFGADWRRTFEFDPPPAPGPSPADETEPEVEVEPVPVDDGDPYAVLAVEASATWEEIVGAHRQMARRHHPDRLAGASDAERTAAEDRIRAINRAYAELKVRRGR